MPNKIIMWKTPGQKAIVLMYVTANVSKHCSLSRVFAKIYIKIL